MAGFYDRAEKTAQKLLFKNGRKAFIERTVPGVSTDPWNPSPSTPQRVQVDIVQDEWTQRERESTLIEQNDLKILVSTRGLTFVPTAEMRLIDGGETYSIVNVQPLRPGPKTIMYIMQVRR